MSTECYFKFPVPPLEGLSFFQNGLLAYLKYRCGKKDFCWAKQAEMARDLGVDRHTLKQALGVLKSKEFLKIKRRQHDTLFELQLVRNTPSQLVRNTPSQLVRNTPSGKSSVGAKSTIDGANRTNCIMEYKKPKRNLCTSELHSDGHESEGKKKRPKNTKTTQGRIAEVPQEAIHVMKTNWLPYAPLHKSSQTPTAKLGILNTLRLLHTQDGYTWEEVGEIVEYAARHWYPAHIGSPASLREWTDKKDRKRHEAIMDQIKVNHAHAEGPEEELEGLRMMREAHQPFREGGKP